jgi:type I restriction enzyme S subunit
MKKGWTNKHIGEIATIKPPKSEARERIPADALVSFLPMEDLGIAIKYPEPKQTKRLSDVVGSYTYFADGDVLLAKITPCFENGKLGIARGLKNGVGFGSSEFIVIRPDGTVNNEWLFYFLCRDDFRNEGSQRMGGAVGQQRVPKEFVESYEIPVPPLAEQQRIVAVLDEAFAGLATAQAHAEKNLQNARELFESYLEAVFTKRGDGWVDKTLDQICIVERGSSPRPIKNYFTTSNDGVNWIKIGDTEEGGKYVYSTAQKITPEGAKRSKFVQEGDFILTNSMSFGRPYIMKTSGYIHDGWFALRLNVSIDSDYLYYLLSSKVVQSQFTRLASGSVVLNISGDLVKQAVLPIAPLTQQHKIVERLMVLSDETQRLESIYQRKFAALEALKKSLLHQAFSGEL